MDGMAMPAHISQQTIKHIKDDVSYPASKEDLVKACDEMSDVPDQDKKWFKETLPDKMYYSVDEVKQAIGYVM